MADRFDYVNQKALAVAIVALEALPIDDRPVSDIADIKKLFDYMVPNAEMHARLIWEAQKLVGQR
jgi:hypothetical protein